MVSKKAFRLACNIVGISGILFITVSGGKGWGIWALILICVFIIAYGYLSTGKWGQHFTGIEEKSKKDDGKIGRAHV